MMRLFVLLLALPLFGCYVGNPAAPGIMDTGLFTVRNPLIKGTSGYVADYASNKHYVSSKTKDNFDPNDVFKEFGVHSQMASFSVILLERLEIFGAAGGSKERAKWQKPSLSDPSSFLVDFDSSYHFSWSAGAKVILMQWGQTFFCGDFTYFAVPSSPHSFFSFFNRLNLPMVEKQEFHLREWQVCAALATRLWIFTPYIGGLYLNSRLHVSGSCATGTINYQNRDSWGWFYGITLSLTGRAHLNFEQRFQAESAYGFSATLVF